MNELSNSEYLLEVDNLTTYFEIKDGLLRRPIARVHAVEGVSFQIMAGETLSIVGESGCVPRPKWVPSYLVDMLEYQEGNSGRQHSVDIENLLHGSVINPTLHDEFFFCDGHCKFRGFRVFLQEKRHQWHNVVD